MFENVLIHVLLILYTEMQILTVINKIKKTETTADQFILSLLFQVRQKRLEPCLSAKPEVSTC